MGRVARRDAVYLQNGGEDPEGGQGYALFQMSTVLRSNGVSLGLCHGGGRGLGWVVLCRESVPYLRGAVQREPRRCNQLSTQHLSLPLSHASMKRVRVRHALF